MGEVALSCEERNNGMASAEEGTKRINNVGDVSAAASSPAAASAAGNDAAAVVRWESFLPKMVLRVLLVEADDSTRQIIAALLRKCSYRVAAVSDGLKAWEVLKGRPHNIDLILTEVELPAISGFALLTLIMEHEICKNIPVIMMSTQDSVSTVYKCMLRGAVDFLVKPVRKNELRNLWQHVWRRQASSSGGGAVPQDESTAQHNKVEATAENNAISNNSCDMACIQKNREYLEKGSDAQSSCTKPELDAERTDTECVQGLTHSKRSKLHSIGNDTEKLESHPILNKKVQPSDHEADGSRDAIGVDAQRMTSVDDKNSGAHWKFGLGPENNYVSNNSVREVIDLIGAFDNYLKCTHRHSGTNVLAANKVETMPQLDLSLRRHPSDSVNQVTDERQQHGLNHSDASPFSRYVNRSVQPQPAASPTSCNQQKDHSSHLTMAQPGEGESTTPRPQQKLLPAPVPVKGMRLDNLCKGFDPMMPQLFRTQSGPSAMQSSGSVNHPETASLSLQANAKTFCALNHHLTGNQSQQYHHSLMMQNLSDMADQTEMLDGRKLETVEDHGHVSSATDQSGNSSFCNGTVNHIQSLHCRASNNEVKADAVVPFVSTTTTAEFGNEELLRSHHDGNSIKSMQREAALTKFRLKRKERCFEKKVRYESRKKLAEKRPRVKGQFVRQVVAESPPGNTPPAG